MRIVTYFHIRFCHHLCCWKSNVSKFYAAVLWRL